MSASRATDAELRLLDLVNEGVALGRLDGRILRVNDAVCRIVGLSEEELLARSWWDLVEPGDRDAVERRLHTIDSADAIREPFRFRLVRPDGSTVRPHRRHPTLKSALWIATPLERWRPDAPERREMFACDFDYSQESDVQETSTACLLMRRRALKRVETFDSGMFPYFHEADLCMRVREAGWRLAYLPHTLALDIDGVAEHGYPDLSPEWHAQRLAWYRKHLGHGAGWWVKACVSWDVSVRLGKELRRRVNGLRQEPIAPVWRAYAGLLRS